MNHAPPFFQRITDAPAYYESVLGPVQSKETLELHVNLAEGDAKRHGHLASVAGMALAFYAPLVYTAITWRTNAATSPTSIMLNPFESPEHYVKASGSALLIILGAIGVHHLASMYSTWSYAKEGKKKLPYW